MAPGDFFGEIGMLDRGSATATVMTTQPTEALVMSHVQFRDAIKANDALALKVITAMAERLRASDPG
jgi:CRP-like cAMP-binding protein